VVTRLVLLTAILTTALSAQAGRAPFDEGMRLMRANEPAKAEAQFERAVKADERNAVYHLWLGNAVGQQAQSANPLRQGLMARRIRAEWERAIELDPSLLDARDALISFYLQAPGFMGGSVAKAREQQREIANRDAFRGHLAAAGIAAFEKDTSAVERAYRAAIAAAPDSVRAVIGLAQRQQSWGRIGPAFATLDGGLARHPRDIALRSQVGRLAAITGQHLPRAEQVLRSLLAEPEWELGNSRPSRAAVHFRLGMVLEKTGDRAGARTEYERAVALDPQLTAAKDALKALR
jgi:tetratricopeptide (TPR) repeat protein